MADDVGVDVGTVQYGYVVGGFWRWEAAASPAVLITLSPAIRPAQFLSIYEVF